MVEVYEKKEEGILKGQKNKRNTCKQNVVLHHFFMWHPVVFRVQMEVVVIKLLNARGIGYVEGSRFGVKKVNGWVEDESKYMTMLARWPKCGALARARCASSRSPRPPAPAVQQLYQ